MTTSRRRSQELDIDIRSEDGQTMAEYSVVLTLIIVVFGIGAFVLLALAISGEFSRVTSIIT
jgi:Flp pilus assembly pilin Flp